MAGISVKLNKTIVILTPGFATNESDSTCIPALQDYIWCLKNEFPDYNIFVLAFQYPFKPGWYNWNGVEVFSAGGRNRKSFFRLLPWNRISRQLKFIHATHKIDVIHSFWLNEASLVGQR